MTMGRRDNTPKDDGLDAYLRGGSRLSDAYRDLPGAEPPAALDEAVLAAARAASGRRRRLVHGPFAGSWLAPAAAAAVVVLAVGLTLFVVDRSGAPVPGELQGEDPALPAAPPPVSGRTTQEESAESRAPAAKRQHELRERRDAAPAEHRFTVEPAPAAAAPEMESGVRKSAPADEADWRASPEAWLAHIESLKRAGRAAEAEASLAEFRRQFPDHPASRVPAQ
jgi:hypothetical protein